ncbi:tripartite tricarboxylate transporter TctB family protein [Aquamicrobium terrae]|uniref:DUF1468 domain-containing protein n=1 Tax=Aquamicrobium terrae TaxID=1324945 RepID=A0ABV2N3W0_9HYPH
MERLKTTAWLPYAVMLLVAVFFWFIADGIDYAARPGTLGPDFWPKAAILLIGITCAYELARAFFLGRSNDTQGLAATLTSADDAEEEVSAKYPRLLVAGAALTVAYGLLLPWLGFPLTTFLYFVCFMYVGRYRRHLAIWLNAALGTLVFCILFMRLVYVSLPRGVPPFDRVTDLIVNMF